jgi:ABC-2 type transport system ATP-binding protein
MNPPPDSIPRRASSSRTSSRILAQQGKTLFISSHILSELGEMCDTLLFIDAGRIVYHGAAEQLRQRPAPSGHWLQVLDVSLLGDPAALYEWVSMRPG